MFMFLKVCLECSHGGVKDGKSHCGREAVYSHLTRYVQQEAMEYYLEHTMFEELPAKMVGNE
jgi:hypothetical protein